MGGGQKLNTKTNYCGLGIWSIIYATYTLHWHEILSGVVWNKKTEKYHNIEYERRWWDLIAKDKS